MSRGPEAVPLDLSEQEQGEIQRLLRRHGTGQALVQRLRIILACAEPGATNLGVATALKVSRPTVALWRGRPRTKRSSRRSVTGPHRTRSMGALVVGLYLAPPDRALVLCVDEKPQIQAVQGTAAAAARQRAHQVIVAHRLVTNPADYRGLVPLVDGVRTHLGRKPREVSGDAGFANEANLVALKERGITGYLAPGRARHGEADAAGRRKVTKLPLMSAMAARLKRAGRRSRYRLRKQVVEPVFGQIKGARGFRRFLRRGLAKVCGEWRLVCLTHNLLKIWRYSYLPNMN